MTELFNLIETGLIDAESELRPMSTSFNCKAVLTGAGRIEFNQQFFDNVDTAMEAAMQHYPDQSLRPLFKATGWQFWSYYNSHRQAWAPLEHVRAQFESREQQKTIRTSDSHPLRIDAIACPGDQIESAGLIGLTFCPGKVTQGLYGGFWRRELTKDLQVLSDWKPDIVITLMESHEFAELGVPDLPNALQALLNSTTNYQWLHLPIRDMNIPDQAFQQRWQTVGPKIHQQLGKGARVVIHCRGGLGRTGLLAAQLLIESGMLAADAIALVRNTRDRTIETFGQEEYLLKM